MHCSFINTCKFPFIDMAGILDEQIYVTFYETDTHRRFFTGFSSFYDYRRWHEGTFSDTGESKKDIYCPISIGTRMPDIRLGEGFYYEKQENVTEISIGDISIEIDSSLGDAFFKNTFRLDPGRQINARAEVSAGIYFEGVPWPILWKDRLSFCVESEDGVVGSSVLRNLGFLAGHMSGDYRFCHSACFEYNKKSILLVGESGSGKSTLSQALGRHILDDDMVLISGSVASSIGASGYINEKNKLIKTGIWQMGIDYVIFMRRTQDPAIGEAEPSQYADVAFDDKLHPCLRYDFKPPDFSGVEAYVLDSGQAVADAVSMIKSIVG
jgi:hypothetical protein